MELVSKSGKSVNIIIMLSKMYRKISIKSRGLLILAGVGSLFLPQSICGCGL